jgi:hypothetical protein
MKMKNLSCESKPKGLSEEVAGWLIAIVLVSFLLAAFGCAKHVYITPDGKQVETSKFALRAMAIRDQNMAVEKSYNDAIKGTSDIQAVALLANKLTNRTQPIDRDPTLSEEGREWAKVILPWLGGGWFNRKSETNSQVYNINGDNNNMSGINNRAIAGRGEVNQTLSNSAVPYQANQAWSQQDSLNSTNGSGAIPATEQGQL